jgi:hypothetical protein
MFALIYVIGRLQENNISQKKLWTQKVGINPHPKRARAITGYLTRREGGDKSRTLREQEQ